MNPLYSLMKSLPDTLHKQYNYEVLIVSGGTQLLYSPFFQVSIPHDTIRIHRF